MDAQDRKDLGIEIRELRKGKRMPDGKKMRQEDLARLAKVSVRTVRNVEAGRSVDPLTISAVTRVLGYEAKEPKWSDEVAFFLNMVGKRLERLDETRRAEFMGEVTRMMMLPR